MQFLSAYLLAAVAVDEGEYTDDYEIIDDDDMQEYFEEAGDDIVGDYIHLDPPTGGSGNGQNFSGNQFCEDWYVAFMRPMEYFKPYVDNVGHYNPKVLKDINKPEEWEGFLTNQPNQLIPQAIDANVYELCNKHVNFWAMGYCARNGRVEPRAWGAYVGSTGTFQVDSNNPTKGYIDFKLASHGDVTKYKNGSAYAGASRGINEDTGAWYTDWWYSTYSVDHLRLVYNVPAYKAYIETLLQQTGGQAANLQGVHYILAECNVEKNWRKKTT